MISHTTSPGFKTWLVWYFLPSFQLTTITVSYSLAFAGVCGRSGKDLSVRFYPRHYIKVGSCDISVPHQWIAQPQVGHVSEYSDGVGCHVLCLRHGIPVWQHIGQSTTATSRHHADMTSDV